MLEVALTPEIPSSVEALLTEDTWAEKTMDTADSTPPQL